MQRARGGAWGSALWTLGGPSTWALGSWGGGRGGPHACVSVTVGTGMSVSGACLLHETESLPVPRRARVRRPPLEPPRPCVAQPQAPTAPATAEQTAPRRARPLDDRTHQHVSPPLPGPALQPLSSSTMYGIYGYYGANSSHPYSFIASFFHLFHRRCFSIHLRFTWSAAGFATSTWEGTRRGRHCTCHIW